MVVSSPARVMKDNHVDLCSYDVVPLGRVLASSEAAHYMNLNGHVALGEDLISDKGFILGKHSL